MAISRIKKRVEFVVGGHIDSQTNGITNKGEFRAGALDGIEILK